MADLKTISQSFFNKRDWDKISNEDKEYSFFIFNRYFSKKYPEYAQTLNIKSIDKVSSMNIWYHFMIDKPYPKWFWSKSKNKTNKKLISKNDYNLLIKRLMINNHDLDYLIENNEDFIKEELKYWKSLEKIK